MKKRLLFALLVIGQVAAAQQWKNVLQFGDGYVNDPLSYGLDKDKNQYVLAGNWNYSCSSCQNNFTRYILRKISKLGTVLWTDTITSALRSITDLNGNTYVLCGTRIVKINTDGKHIWQNNDTDAVYFRAVVHSSGDIIVFGRHKTNPEPNKTIITRLDKDGNKVWSRKCDFYLYAASAETFPIAIDQSDNIYIAGCTQSGPKPYLLVKYDASGNILQTIELANNYAKSLNVDKTGAIYVASLGLYTKYDTQGNLMWTNKINMNSNAVIDATHDFLVGTDAKNNVYFSFRYNKSISIDNDFSLNCNHHQLLIVKYDSNGNFQWVKETAGDQGSAYPRGILITSPGEVTVLAELAAVKDFGAFNVHSKGYKDLLIVTLMEDYTVAALTEIKDANSTIKVFPNPSGSIFTLAWKETLKGEMNISVYNVTGAEVFHTSCAMENMEHTVNLAHLAKGAYFIKLQAGECIESKKIILE